ncbi:inorganic phosphate transmembrane transporter [Aureococcus anophagefferens]|nr:inorganic phosphate transmembrane transporter [Aureococcus anophagefferens]
MDKQGSRWIVVAGFVACFLMAMAMGANDVANAFGTSVGAGVVTLRQALVLAAVCNVGGAVLMSGAVTETIRKGIVDVGARAGAAGGSPAEPAAARRRAALTDGDGGDDGAAAPSPFGGADGAATVAAHGAARSFDPDVEAVFGASAGRVRGAAAFAAGANDVANEVAPVAAIWQTWADGEVRSTARTPKWLFLTRARRRGPRPLRARHAHRGRDATKMTPARGFNIELGYSLASLVASAEGWPVSTTQLCVGAVVGVGLASGDGARLRRGQHAAPRAHLPLLGRDAPRRGPRRRARVRLPPTRAVTPRRVALLARPARDGAAALSTTALATDPAPYAPRDDPEIPRDVEDFLAAEMGAVASPGDAAAAQRYEGPGCGGAAASPHPTPTGPGRATRRRPRRARTTRCSKSRSPSATALSVAGWPGDGHRLGAAWSAGGAPLWSYGASADVAFAEVGWARLAVVDETRACWLAAQIAVRYVRREVRSLSDRDREAFLQGVMAMQRLPADGAGFVTSHVALTLEYERSLQAIYPWATVPYWDISLESTFYDAAAWRTSAVFRGDWFGAAAPANGLRALAAGRFAFAPTMANARRFSLARRELCGNQIFNQTSM